VHNVVHAVIIRYAFCNSISDIHILSNCCTADFKCIYLGEVLCTRTNEMRRDAGRLQITTNSTRYSLKRALPPQPPSQQDCTKDVSEVTCRAIRFCCGPSNEMGSSSTSARIPLSRCMAAECLSYPGLARFEPVAPFTAAAPRGASATKTSPPLAMLPSGNGVPSAHAECVRKKTIRGRRIRIRTRCC
jgi:hypothetical protein